MRAINDSPARFVGSLSSTPSTIRIASAKFCDFAARAAFANSLLTLSSESFLSVGSAVSGFVPCFSLGVDSVPRPFDGTDDGCLSLSNGVSPEGEVIDGDELFGGAGGAGFAQPRTDNVTRTNQRDLDMGYILLDP